MGVTASIEKMNVADALSGTGHHRGPPTPGQHAARVTMAVKDASRASRVSGFADSAPRLRGRLTARSLLNSNAGMARVL